MYRLRTIGSIYDLCIYKQGVFVDTGKTIGSKQGVSVVDGAWCHSGFRALDASFFTSPGTND